MKYYTLDAFFLNHYLGNGLLEILNCQIFSIHFSYTYKILKEIFKIIIGETDNVFVLQDFLATGRR